MTMPLTGMTSVYREFPIVEDRVRWHCGIHKFESHRAALDASRFGRIHERRETTGGCWAVQIQRLRPGAA